MPIEEPGRDFVLGRVLDDGDNALEFFRRDFASTRRVVDQLMDFPSFQAAADGVHKGRSLDSLPFIQVDIGFLADQVRITATYTLDLGQGVHDLLLSIDVGVEKSEDELEVRLLAGNER